MLKFDKIVLYMKYIEEITFTLGNAWGQIRVYHFSLDRLEHPLDPLLILAIMHTCMCLAVASLQSVAKSAQRL